MDPVPPTPQTQPTPPIPTVPMAVPPAKPKSKTWLLILAGVVLLGVGLVAGILLGK